jgi:xyloglucan:xyloglucosyl transferase
MISLAIVSTDASPPRKPMNVPFGKNYVPTWAYDHIRYFNGGNDIQLVLDKSTGILQYTIK